MPHNNLFDPDKMQLVHYRLVNGQVHTPEHFDVDKTAGHTCETEFDVGFSLEEKLVKTDITVTIKSDSKGANTEESSAVFQLAFFYHVQNLEELAVVDKDHQIHLNPALLNALTTITYSTTRGILLTRLQGTSLQAFILPIVNPNKLIPHKKN